MPNQENVLAKEPKGGRNKAVIWTAGIILALIVAAGIVVFSVEPWRAAVLNSLFHTKQVNEINSSSVESADEGSGVYSDEYVTLNYVPEGFKLAENNSDRRSLYLNFTNGEQYFQVTVNESDAKSSVDTEAGSRETVMVNGYEATYTTNHNIDSVTWHVNEYVYRVLGNIEKEELLKIAENLEK